MQIMSSPIRKLLALGLVLTPAFAQVDRYELGLRLRAFERELALASDPLALRAAFVAMNDAVQSFFRMDLRGVALGVEAAHWQLQQTAPSPEERFARSLQMTLAARLLSTGEGTLQFTCKSVYPEPKPEGKKLQLLVAILGIDKLPRISVTLDELPLNKELPLAHLPPGDHTLQWRICENGKDLVVREQGLSLAKDLDARLALLLERDQQTVERTTIEAATERHLTRMLQGMTKQRSEETILPGERLLRECEALAKIAEATPYYQKERVGQFWLRVPTGKGTTTIRLVVPPPVATATELIPLVLALHGAGGSENLFCDGYGDGAIVKLCAQRGFILCAPRVAGFGGSDLPALIETLATRYPIDRKHVFIIGHSMGAMATIEAVMQTPACFAAAAAISGGGVVKKSAALAKLPFFVAAGSADFGKGASEKLHQKLQAAGINSSWHEYPDVEHLSIVQIALPDVFTFFDQQLQR